MKKLTPLALAFVALAGACGEQTETARARGEGMQEAGWSNVAELAGVVQAAAVVRVVGQRETAIGSTGYTVSAARVTEVLKGPWDVGDEVDLRQMGLRNDGPVFDQPMMDPGSDYVVFARDVQLPNDRPVPFFHVFGLYGLDGDSWRHLAHESPMADADRTITLNEIRSAIASA
ncbi:MAG TPA: hypothetical protein VF230_10985 [Acidimicrobiales bacterium]